MRATASRWKILYPAIRFTNLLRSGQGHRAWHSIQPTMMKFMPTDSWTRRGSSICIECHRSLSGNLRDVSTRRPCRDYDVVSLPGEESAHAMALCSRRARALLPPAAATCWHSIVLAQTALRLAMLVLPRRIRTTQIHSNLSTFNRRSQEKRSCSESIILEIGGC